MDIFEQALFFQLLSRRDSWKWPPSRTISTQNSRPSWHSFSASSSVSWCNPWEEETWRRSEPRSPSPIAPSRHRRAWLSSCRFCSFVSYDIISISLPFGAFLLFSSGARFKFLWLRIWSRPSYLWGDEGLRFWPDWRLWRSCECLHGSLWGRPPRRRVGWSIHDNKIH